MSYSTYNTQLLPRSQHELAALASMVVASLPYPPLPVVALQGEDGADGVASSFDLLQTAVMNEQLRHCASRAAADIARSKTETLKSLQKDIAALHASALTSGMKHASLEQVYSLFCSSFRKYLLEHYPTSTTDLRFYPLEAVGKESVLVQQACSHWSAACQLAGDDHSSAVKFVSYKHVLRQYALDLATLE